MMTSVVKWRKEKEANGMLSLALGCCDMIPVPPLPTTTIPYYYHQGKHNHHGHRSKTNHY